MKPFKITHYKQKNRFRWLNWIVIGLGFVHLYWAWDSYFFSIGSHDAIFDLLIGLFWIAFGYVNLFRVGPLPDITIDADGITVEEETSRLLQWNTIRNIKLDNNTLFVLLDTGREEELNIWTIKYKELQIFKQRLKEFSSTNDITYSSKD